MARRLNRLVRIVLSAALVVLSSGLDAQQAFAQTVAGRAAPVSAAPQLGLGSVNAPIPSLAAPVLSLSAPSLSAPSALTGTPLLAAPVAAAPAALKPGTPAAAIAEKVLAAAPALQALAKPETGSSAASAAGRDLEDILTGAKSARVSASDDSVAAGVPSALTPSLSAPSAAPEAPKTAVPAAAPQVQAPKTVESSSSYMFHRLALKTIAALTGAVFSLPQAGAALSAKIIASAADKRLVVSDFDDTLAGYNAVLPQEKVDAIRAIRKAGKHFAVVSDRGDEKRPGSTQLTVFESLASLPADATEGMFVAANSGGKLYQYQNGVPVKVWEAEALAAEKLDAVKEASAATIARLSEAGVEQHPGDSLNPKESYNTYGYALMIKVGATPAQMKQVAAIMGEELAKRGIEVEVMGRLPKDPANPGYATFSIITKAPATAKIAEKLGLSADDALVIGDMMYVPRAAKKASWLTRLGLKLSGLPIGETGNETDRNMSKGLPGVLAIGVGRKMDPRIPNGWNLADHGPDVTQKVLEAVASKPAPPGDGSKAALKALEAKYAADLGKLPGVAQVKVEDSTFFYGGNLNDTRGKDIRVVFSGVPEMQAARASLPETLPAIDGVKAVARYNVIAEVEKSAQREAYRALESKYAADLAKVPGVSQVKVEDSTFFYGGNLNDTRGKDIRVVFSGVPEMQAARASLPETLPAIDGIKAVARYNVIAEVEKSAQREAYRALESKYAAELGKLPGVAQVKVEDSTFFYGGNLNDTRGKDIRVVFADVASMQQGRAALPETLPAIDGIKAVARYNVLADVSESKGWLGAEAYLQWGLVGAIVGLGALGWYAFASALGDIVRMGEEAVRNWQLSPFGQDAGFFLGATTLGMAGILGAGRSVLSNPNDTYATALKQAREIAAKRGVPADRVEFVEATAGMPVRDGAQWKYAFSVPGALIYVDFSTFLGNGQDFRASVYEGALPSHKAYPISAEGFSSFVALTPDAALSLLKNEVPGFGSGVSVSLALRPAADGNGSQMSYKFYDDAGSVGTVGAAGAFVRADRLSDKAAKAATKPAGLTHAVAPNELYALALEKITAKAATAGVPVSRITFLSGVHETRSFNGAWVGDEWRFHFGWGGENGGVEYMVPARRTMVSETMMDAFEPELKGMVSAERLAEGMGAAYFDLGVKLGPDAALKSVDGVTRVSLLPRVGPANGDRERDLWYSYQDSRSELASMNARTGEVRKAAPAAPKGSALKSFLLWLGGVALVAAIYGGFYWAASHAPVAAPAVPEGWNGPIPTVDDFFRGMGGVLGLGMLAGSLRAKKAKVTDDEIASAAKSVASSKGGIWSQTEYNMAYYNTLESLKSRGATKKQLALFEKLCAEAPVIGGRFNPWSGD